MNTATLIQYMRDILDVPEVLSPWTEAELLRYLNRELVQRYAEMIWVDATWFLLQSDSTSLGFTSRQVPGEQRWLLSFPEWIHTIVRLDDQKTTLFDVSLIHTTPRKIQARAGEVGPYYGDTSSRWMFSGRDAITLFVDPAGKTFRVWYTKVPPKLVRFAATGGSTTTITVDMSLAPTLGEWVPVVGEYVGGFIEVASAGNAQPQGERATIIACTGTFPSFTLTLDRALTAAIDAADVIDMHPTLRDADQEIIVYGAAIRALDRKGAMQQRLILTDTYRVLHQGWMQSITKRQTMQPGKAVTPAGRIDS